MARVTYLDPVKEVHGAVEKHGEIYRRKYYRDKKISQDVTYVWIILFALSSSTNSKMHNNS